MKRKFGIRAAVLFLLFAGFTCLVAVADVRPVGPEGTAVGLAGINLFVFRSIGVHLVWYRITDWLGLVPVAAAAAFGLVGLYQLVRRRSLRKVDRGILALGGVYALTAGCYLLFERVVVNYRPVLLGGGPEASYPSSHTVLAVTVLATAALRLRAMYPTRRGLCRGAEWTAAVLIAVTVVGRLLSGVHWFTDIVGSLLLSAALVAGYRSLE